MGLWPMLDGCEIGPIGVDKINGPPRLGLASGGVFVAFGLIVAIGERVCSGSISLPFFATSDQYSDLACRIPFGLGALIANAALFLGLVNFLKKSLGASPRPDPVEQIGRVAVHPYSGTVHHPSTLDPLRQKLP